MSTSLDDKTISDLRNAERERLFQLPDFPSERPKDEKGVLLSNRIQHYCLDYHLIWPFDPELLRPAGYDLTVGRNYSKLGRQFALNEGMSLEIGPYQVAIIETRETLNLPEFLIGRWNIRVQLAYAGLLWVGGAQVDPGFRGYLCCPIYNLSTKPVQLNFGERLAMIDFVTTTPYTEGECKKFDYRNRKKLLFGDYDLLSSGIEAEVRRFTQTIEETKRETVAIVSKAETSTTSSFTEIRTRIDTFVTLTFTVVAVLFAGLGIIATKGSDAPAFLNSPIWVAGIALFFALRASMDASAQRRAWFGWLPAGVLAVLATFLVLAASTFFSAYNSHAGATEVRQAKEQAKEAKVEFEQDREEREAAIREFRQESDKLNKLIQQGMKFQPGEAAPK